MLECANIDGLNDHASNDCYTDVIIILFSIIIIIIDNIITTIIIIDIGISIIIRVVCCLNIIYRPNNLISQLPLFSRFFASKSTWSAISKALAVLISQLIILVNFMSLSLWVTLGCIQDHAI